MSDDEIWRLNRGGHDPHKIYAAYAAAMKHQGEPTVILAKTVKGYGMGESGEGQNITHQQKKMGTASIKAFRDRFAVPIPDDQLEKMPFYKPGEDSPEMKYMRSRMKALGGSVPARRRKAKALEVPPLSAFEALTKGTDGREISTTMAFVRMLNTLVRDKNIGKLVVPIVPDESRTFGMEGMFRQLGIYSSLGQLYTPQDSEQLMYYKEDKSGQILQEGINEAGGMCSWIAAATSYSTHNQPMIPFYIYYSMFGFQRVGDLWWAAGDMRARGFLLGGTSGRTTLNGEGLQHEDGHSQVLASAIPNCVSYDPTYAYELAVIIQDGLRRMYQEQEDIYYYITVMNENYAHPPMPAGAEKSILRGMHLISPAKSAKGKLRVQLMGSGAILREVIAGAELLEKDFGVSADIWSVTSFNELRRDGMETARWNMLHPESEPRVSYVEQCLRDHSGPVIAATDYMKVYADQIRAYLPQPAQYLVLGTDGFGRSDTRRGLRGFFEVDRRYVAVAALKSLADQEALPQKKVVEAIRKYGVDPEKPSPTKV
jgi:pyruvate dehydrogenase E1 component